MGGERATGAPWPVGSGPPIILSPPLSSGAHRHGPDDAFPGREVVWMENDEQSPPPPRRRPPIDWAKWLAALGSVVGAIAAVVRSLHGG
jgi:hypothetical protein